ncbi:MAG TPA: 50S ribosomal protein L4 [Dehalococcoidia bacterium]|nr:50S ribosomal protein L4 [Dehalococcoidia bacterium]
MEVPVYNTSGEVVKNIELSDSVFAVPFNQAVVHQAVVRQRANARQGTVSTKTRGQVIGSSAKMYRQKHTGMARAGSRKSPLRRGGGITFGPKPRSYRQSMPKKMHRLAIRCVLSAKARDEELKVLEEIKLKQPKTKEMAGVMAALGIDSSALLVTGKPEENVYKSARNLTGIKVMPASILSVVDILSYRKLLMTETAVRKAEEIWGGGNASV